MIFHSPWTGSPVQGTLSKSNEMFLFNILNSKFLKYLDPKNYLLRPLNKYLTWQNDINYNLISPDCPEQSDLVSFDNCFPGPNTENYNIIDLVNNLSQLPQPDGIPDCISDFNYDLYSNPLQTDSDGDGIGNNCDNNSSGGDGNQIGCTDEDACNYDFWADILCEDCCEYCYLGDCDNYPSFQDSPDS